MNNYDVQFQNKKIDAFTTHKILNDVLIIIAQKSETHPVYYLQGEFEAYLQ